MECFSTCELVATDADAPPPPPPPASLTDRSKAILIFNSSFRRRRS